MSDAGRGRVLGSPLGISNPTPEIPDFTPVSPHPPPGLRPPGKMGGGVGELVCNAKKI